jgi:hypothetical protein
MEFTETNIIPHVEINFLMLKNKVS